MSNMMGCRCELCGALIYSGHVSSLTGVDPMMTASGVVVTAEEIEAAKDLAEFDLLSARVAGHISQSHPKQAHQMAAFGFLASKVYAMTHAQTSYEADKFRAIRAAWKDGIVKAMKDQPAAGEAPAPAGSTEAAPPIGS
jgi:hypothetical protein